MRSVARVSSVAIASFSAVLATDVSDPDASDVPASCDATIALDASIAAWLASSSCSRSRSRVTSFISSALFSSTPSTTVSPAAAAARSAARPSDAARRASLSAARSSASFACCSSCAMRSVARASSVAIASFSAGPATDMPDAVASGSIASCGSTRPTRRASAVPSSSLSPSTF